MRSTWSKKAMTLGVILVAHMLLVCPVAEADEASYSPATYAVASLLIIDVGAAVANGIALSVGRPNRRNGYFGVVAGVASLGLVAVSYATTENDDLRNEFALVMGSAGLASLALGVLNVRHSRDPGDELEKQSRVTVLPNLVAVGDKSYRVGIGIRMTF